MKVELTRPPGTFVEGVLKSVVVSEQDGPFPTVVIELAVNGVADHPARVTLGALDLSTIIEVARGSTIERIRDAVT
jgi:hypothetical protein